MITRKERLVWSTFLVVFILAATLFTSVQAKPSEQFYAWNLSGEVMPVPPYGSRDIPGSDEASKLIVNQPKGDELVTIYGVMNGLHPYTTYTVYLSRGYDKYTPTDVRGNYTWLVLGTYEHDITIALQNPDGTTGWPGLFTSSIQPFTFTTDDTGSGSWHINMRASGFPNGPGTPSLTSGPDTLSVWINEAGGTMLISDPFEV